MSTQNNQNYGEIVLYFEEPSAKEMVQILIDKYFTEYKQNINFIFNVLRGKEGLLKNIYDRINEYRTPYSYFIILLDQDKDDCKTLKQDVHNKLKNFKNKKIKVRIACTELESFYLGDLGAVAQAFNDPQINNELNRRNYNNPDRIQNAKEKLKLLTNGQYQQIAGTRRIAPLLNIHTNKSASFGYLINAIKELAEQLNPDKSS